jgi:hypothetical protein
MSHDKGPTRPLFLLPGLLTCDEKFPIGAQIFVPDHIRVCEQTVPNQAWHREIDHTNPKQSEAALDWEAESVDARLQAGMRSERLLHGMANRF